LGRRFEHASNIAGELLDPDSYVRAVLGEVR
jgi:hypothetical protein